MSKHRIADDHKYLKPCGLVEERSVNISEPEVIDRQSRGSACIANMNPRYLRDIIEKAYLLTLLTPWYYSP